MTITPSKGEPRNPAAIDPKSSVMTLPIAYAIVTQAILRARNKFQMETFSVAVVDGGGHLTGFGRQNNAWLGSVDEAIKKARTAIFYENNSETLTKPEFGGTQMSGVQFSNDGLIAFPGGLLVKNRKGDTNSKTDKIIGAIGVSGKCIKGPCDPGKDCYDKCKEVLHDVAGFARCAWVAQASVHPNNPCEDCSCLESTPGKIKKGK